MSLKDQIGSVRRLKNPSFILLDEGDFFMPHEQQNARDISERYIAKSNPYIIMISAPNAPGMLFDKINREPEEQCIYKRLRLDYTYGLNKFYSNEDIAQARKSPFLRA